MGSGGDLEWSRHRSPGRTRRVLIRSKGDESVQTRWEQRKILVTIPDEIVSGAFEQGQVDQTRL